MSNYTVYIHTAPNNKKYVGITLDIKKRWRNNGNGYKYQRLFWRAIQKYGWNNFTHEIVAENLTKEEACDMEIELIAKYKSNNPEYGYNVATGGEHNCGYHFNHTEETKRKISNASKGHITSEEQKKKISLARKGKFHHTDKSKELLRQRALNMSEEQKKKISESVKKRWKEGRYVHTGDNFRNNTPWNKGLTKDDPRIAKHCRKVGQFNHTEETKRKISESHKGLPAKNRKKIMCVETKVVYESISYATKMTGINNISKAIKKNCKAGGYHWMEVKNE